MEEKDITVNSEVNAVEMDINSDADVPGNTHLSNPIDSETNSEMLEKLQLELDEQKDKYIRLLAEFENSKRRTAKERIELFQTAGKEIVSSLLDVVDDTDRALLQMEESEDLNQIKEGNKLVFLKLKNVLQQKGLKLMESIGEAFDVEKHEAITEVDAAEDQKGKVIDVIQNGYLLNDKIIRFAKVVVGK